MKEDRSELRVFLGGMDFDSEDHSVEQGMYRILLNGRNGPRLKGVIENVKGNIPITNPFLPTSGTNKCIGSCEDISDNSLVFANWNSEGYHGFYRFYINKPGYVNGSIEKLVVVDYPQAYTFDFPNPLDFDQDHLITGINIVEDLLYWTDYFGRPKMMNLKKANNTLKRKKFKICFNKSNFETATQFTFNVYEHSNPVPVGSFTYFSYGATYQERCDEFQVAYSISNCVELFSIDNCNQAIDIEMTSPGDYFVNVVEVGYKSATVNVGANATQNVFVLYFQVNPSLAIGDTIQIFNLTTLTYLNGLTLTISGGGPVTGNPFANFIFFATAPVVAPATFNTDLGVLVYIPLIQIPTPNQSVIIPQNFYPEKDLGLEAAGITTYDYLRYDFFDQLKYPPQCMPTARYGTDVKRETNLVKNQVWQFRAKYIYDNYENSVYGSVSNIPMPNISCDDHKNYGNNDNYIDVDFMDQRLVNPSTVSIIKKVVLAVQIHNNGEWREMQVLEQYQFAGMGQNVFRFFNDQTYRAIATTETNRPYDSLFRKAKSQEFVDDRLFNAGGLEGYPTTCLDAKINERYLPAANDVRYKIKGRIYIRCILEASPSYVVNTQPIWTPKGSGGDNGQVVFGGMGQSPLAGALYDFWIGAGDMGASGRYHQTIPLEGFIVYAAGTDYWCKSKQKATGATSGSQNIYSGYTPAQREDCRDEMKNGNVYSEFELEVPPGRYVIRLASHLVTQSDMLSSDRRYQRTSTTTFNVGGTYWTECVVDVINSDVTIGDTEVADLSSPNHVSALGLNLIPIAGVTMAVGIAGYLVDSDNPPPNTTYDEWLEDTRIERAMIDFNSTYSFGNVLIALLTGSTGIISAIWSAYTTDGRATTDHNGFFWFSEIQSMTSNLNTADVHIGNQIAVYSALDSGNNPFTGTMDYGTRQIAIKQVSASVKENCRTFLQGKVLQANTLLYISGASVVNTKGHVGVSDVQGDFNLICYVDTVLVLYGPPVGNFRIDEVIVFEGSPLCKTLPDYVSKPYNITIQDATLTTEYDYAYPYYMGEFLFQILSSATSISAEKRGSDIQYAIAYYDEGDRRCVALTSPVLKKHFLFYTEKDPLTGLLAPFGRPVVEWEIFNEPPQWAVKYQWLRTANLQLNGWLQWSVNKITYVSKNETNIDNPNPSGFLDANTEFAVLNLQSIGYYVLNDHPDAVINFTFVAGDHIRFIADESGAFFTELYDFEIVKILGQNYVYLYKDVNFEIKDNYQFEVYSPRNRSQVNLFYEFGECFDVKTAVINGIRRKYHAGPDQDQSYGTLPLQTVTPAKGTFKTGSAYYRRRQVSQNAILAVTDPPVLPSSGAPFAFNIDDPSVSDFYLSADYSIGRVLSAAEIPGEVYRPSAIRFSDRYITGSKTNGLNTWQALNDKQFSSDFGLIVKLKLRNNTVLVAVFDNSYTVSLYINQGILRQTTGAGIVAISDDVIPRTHISQRTFGSSNPESIFLNDQADLFGWDEKQGVVWRMSGDQMIEVSDYKAATYFKDKSVLRNILDRKKSKTPSVYDLYYDEYVLNFNALTGNPGLSPEVTLTLPNYETNLPGGITFKFTVLPLNIVLAQYTSAGTGITGQIAALLINATAATTGNGFAAEVNIDGGLKITAPNDALIYGNQTLLVEILGAETKSYHFSAGQVASATTSDIAETIAFVKDKNFWTSFYDFKPEYFGRIRNDIISFVDGQLWLHDKNPLYNNFYGGQYKRQLKAVFNADGEKVKNFQNIAESADNINYCPLITIPPGPQTPNGMLSELKKNHFKTVTNKFYAAFLRDKNTPKTANIPDVLTAWINGRVLNGQCIIITLEDDSIQRSTLSSVKIHYFWSEYS